MPQKIKKDTYIKICPYCHSNNVGPDTSNYELLGSGLFVNSNVCRDCGHSSSFFPQIEANKDLSEIKISHELKKQLINTSHIRNRLREWKLTAPMGIIFAVFLIIFSKEKLFFQLGVLGLLPISTMFLIAAYRNDLIQKYNLLKILFILILFYTIIIGVFYFMPRMM